MCRVTQLKVLLTWLIHMCDTWLTHLHIWVIHIIDLLEPRDTHTNESHVTHMNESCHRPPRAAHSRTIATAGRDSTRIQPPARAPAFSTAVFIRTKSPTKFAKEPYKICKTSPTEIQPPACASPSCTAVFICTKSPRKSAKSPNQFRKKRLENPRKEPYRYAFANLRCALASGTAVYNCKMSPIKWAKEPSNDAKEPISNPQQ